MGISEGTTRFEKHANTYIIIGQNIFQITEESKHKTTAACKYTYNYTTECFSNRRRVQT